MLAKEAATVLGFSISTLHRKTDSGLIPVSYIKGGLRLFREEDILAYKEKITVGEGVK